MMEVGRLCVKVAGRNAGKKCAIVEVVDANYVIVDGQVKRKRCNISHLEPLHHVLPLQPGASHDEVVAALKEAGIDIAVEERKFMKPKAVPPAATEPGTMMSKQEA